MDHYVKLDHLPPDLQFPPELANRIRYDSQKKSLVYHGPMSKATYDKLLKVHSDGEYRRAIEKLFCQATYVVETSNSRNWIRVWVTAGVVLVLMIAVAVICWLIQWK